MMHQQVSVELQFPLLSCLMWSSENDEKSAWDRMVLSIIFQKNNLESSRHSLCLCFPLKLALIDDKRL